MSTPSTIVVHLRPEDRNKTFETPFGTFIKPNGMQYLSVYCHYDGCPSGVGEYLAKEITTYEKAIEFICEGERSTVYNGTGDPKYGTKISNTLGCTTDYLYVLDYEEGSNGIIVKMADPDLDEDAMLNIDPSSLLLLSDYLGSDEYYDWGEEGENNDDDEDDE